MVKFAEGNMFDHKHDCYVNTVNCLGAMGAGIALEFKKRAPLMFAEYQSLCKADLIAPGDCWWTEDSQWTTIALLAIKNHWQNCARYSWAKMAIRNFVNLLEDGTLEGENIALPQIGAVNGGRGRPLPKVKDNWMTPSEEGYRQHILPFYLNELKRVPKKLFTIYKLTTNEDS